MIPKCQRRITLRNASNRGLLNAWRRSPADLSTIRASLRTAGNVRAVTMLENKRFTRVRRRISLPLASGRIEIVVAGARMTMIGAVALARAIVAALRGRR